MIELVHGLDLTAVQEGVETIEQLQRLHEMGCDIAQGFYFSRPLPTEAIGALLHRNLLGGGAWRLRN